MSLGSPWLSLLVLYLNASTIAIFFSLRASLSFSSAHHAHCLPALVGRHFSGCRPFACCPPRSIVCWLGAFKDRGSHQIRPCSCGPPGVPAHSGIDTLVQDALQVTLALNFASLSDYDTVSNLLTTVIILRSFLMFLQISPACQSSVIEVIISLGKYFPDGFDFCGLCPMLVTEEGGNDSVSFLCKVLMKKERDYRTFFSFLPNLTSSTSSQGFISQHRGTVLVLLCGPLTFIERVMTTGCTCLQASHLAVFLPGKHWRIWMRSYKFAP